MTTGTDHPGPLAPRTTAVDWDDEAHVVAELGLEVRAEGDVLRGRATVVEELCVPGTAALRTSVVLTWADVLAGTAAGFAMEPRIPLTLDLEVQVVRAAPPGMVVEADTFVVRAGRSVVVSGCRFSDAAGSGPVAVAIASFVPAPDPTHVFPDGFPVPEVVGPALALPLAERLACRVVAPGVAEMPRRADALNAVGAMQGGLASLAMEEAVTSLLPAPTPLSSFTVRYLRPVMEGPARAVATAAGDVHTVELTDTATGKVCLYATARPHP